jgi:hypothetical protein
MVEVAHQILGRKDRPHLLAHTDHDHGVVVVALLFLQNNFHFLVLHRILV